MDWENSILDRRLARVEGASSLSGPSDAGTLECEARAAGVDLLVARVPADAVAVRSLQRAGFVTADVGVTFAADLPTRAPAAPVAPLREASPGDLPALRTLVAGMFVNSYYYASGFFSPAEADRLHEAWITNGVEGRRGERVLVATAGDRPVGFVTCRALADALGVIDLIGVGTTHATRGIGKALLHGAADVFARLGCGRVRVRTQITNIAAVNLYASAGYRLVEVDTTLMRSLVKETPA
jgi:dTDP-4-amino-4,6-dideoxy-D-galactose acyltransferase